MPLLVSAHLPYTCMSWIRIRICISPYGSVFGSDFYYTNPDPQILIRIRITGFRTYLSRIRIFPDRIWIFGRSGYGSGLRKKSDPDPEKYPDPTHCIKSCFLSYFSFCAFRCSRVTTFPPCTCRYLTHPLPLLQATTTKKSTALDISP